METSLQWKIVVGQRRYTNELRTVGGEEEDHIIMEEPSDGLHEKQKPGRRYGKIDIFGVWKWMDGSCIDPNKKNSYFHDIHIHVLSFSIWLNKLFIC
jgi:hypothetical protein